MFRTRISLLAFCLFALSQISYAKCVSKDLKFTWEYGAPDGQGRYMIMTNGGFPAPLLEFDEGDNVEVHVDNSMDFNITVHWHGLLQQGTPWSDGVPGLSQNEIMPGDKFVYRFKAEPAGTYWYHSHSKMNLVDGLYGSMFIKPSSNATYPFDFWNTNGTENTTAMRNAARNPNILMASDWAAYTSDDWINATKTTNLDIFCIDSVLINGKGSSYCPGQSYMANLTSATLTKTFNGSTVTDKGCFPFVGSTQGDYFFNTSLVHPDLIPEGMHSGCINSTGDMEVVTVDPNDTWASLNFIGAATYVTTEWSVDNHTLLVYEVDGGFVEPFEVQALITYAGERYSALIKLDQEPGNYTIRATDSGVSQIISGYGILQYTNGNDNVTANLGPFSSGYIDYGGNNMSIITVLDSSDHTTMAPYPAVTIPQNVDQTLHIYPDRHGAPWIYTMIGANGNQSWPSETGVNTPLLYNPDQDMGWNNGLTMRTKMYQVIDIVAEIADTSLGQESSEFLHLMHKHSTKMWIIGHGKGQFNWSTVAEAATVIPESFNLVNATYRDTFVTTFGQTSWVAARYQVTTPGAWFFHCHIESHLYGGMGMAFLDGVDAWPTIPAEYAVNQNGFFPYQDTTTWGSEEQCSCFATWGDSSENPGECGTDMTNGTYPYKR